MSQLSLNLFKALPIMLISLPTVGLEETSKRPELAIGTMLGSLILVLACIFLFAFLMKKSNLLRHGGNKNPIKVIATQPLTNKSRVQIVEVYGKQYLLGVSEQSINLLEQIDSSSIEQNEIQNDQVPPSLATAFATVLSKARNKKNA